MPEANTVSGSEGKIVVATVEILVTKWDLERDPTLAERTNATSGGWMTRGLVKKSAKFAVDYLWDSTATPEDNSLDQGDTVTAKFRIGNSTKGYMAVPCIVGNCRLTGCTQDGLVTGSAELFVNGVLPDPTTYS